MSQVTSQTKLNLNFCADLEVLPLGQLVEFPLLKSIECKGCLQLYYPPFEICSQGGEAVMELLREVRRCGQYSKSITLFLMGDGEAGKTSVVRALKSKEDRTAHIRADHRTVGIDISAWRPKNTDLTFRIFDLAGQAVYSKTHQLFLLQRAIYLFVWRAGDMKIASLKQTVLYWLTSLQNRIPGSFMLIAVTHIDQVHPSQLNAQCYEVKRTVEMFRDTLKLNAHDGSRLPCIWDDGESVRVNCLSGHGIQDLRDALMAFTRRMPWYKEALPASWIQLQDSLHKRSRDDATSPFLSWQDYQNTALSLSVPQSMLRSVTRFLHDTGCIRYFGDFNATHLSTTALQNTVYISLVWMVNVMKGLIRHD